MTYNPFDQDTVLQQSGLRGRQSDPHYTQPDNFEVGTTGGGSVQFNTLGAEVNAGATSGDSAYVRYGWDRLQLNAHFPFLLEVAWSYETDNVTSGVHPLATIGLGAGGGSRTLNLKLDTEEVIADGSVIGNFTMPGNDRLAYTAFYMDPVISEWTIYHKPGGDQALETFSDAGFAGVPNIMVPLYSESNGTAQNLFLDWVRFTWDDTLTEKVTMDEL